MKTEIQNIVLVFIAGVLFILSCKKEKSCEGCAGSNNKPPIAVAGPDQVITLPTDSVLLDGRTSNDPDGRISSYLWTKISGPAFFTIIRPSDSVTKIKDLVKGTYLFELKVTDNGGVYAKDTIQVTVNDLAQSNRPPIAKAGPDQIITLPTNSVTLDGSGSTDPDNNITSYSWAKISGPSSFIIANANVSQTQVTNLNQGVYLFELKVTDNGGLSAKDTVQITVNDATQSNHRPVAKAGTDQTISLPINMINLDGSGSTDADNNITAYTWTKVSGPVAFTISNASAMLTQVTNLIEGVYEFELKVTDAGGLFDKDTVQITVNGVVTTSACDGRPIIHANLVEIGTLSEPRFGLVSATANNKILFAGGQKEGGYSSRVDIYDIATNTWSSAELSNGDRMDMAAATVGNKILFAGGNERDNGTPTSRVDMYDASTNSWSQAELSQPRWGLAAATVGNKVLFAGGASWGNIGVSNVVDIYDNATNTWTTAHLSKARSFLSANTIGNKIYFAGGVGESGIATTTVDIYDNATNAWSTTDMQEAKSNMASAVFKNNIFWAGGHSSNTTSNLVEIKNVNTGVFSFNCVMPRIDFSAVTKDDNIIFFTGITPDIPLSTNQFEIYNTTTGTWSTGVLNQNIWFSTIISVNNTIYVAGGATGNIFNATLLNKVWKLEF
jgi:K319L-like, PKD domain/Kelch motif